MTTALARPNQMRSLIAAAKAGLKSIARPEAIERMGMVLMAEGARNPKLHECTPTSFAMCVQLAGQLGLEPTGPLGHFYLIPRRNQGTMECTALIGYKGLLELARRSGQIVRINANVVYRDEITSGLFVASIEPPEISHKLSLDEINRTDDAIVAAYCVAELRDGGKAQVVLTRQDIERRREQSQGANSSYSPWRTDFPAMARKSAIRALLNGGTVPLSAETQRALWDDPDHKQQPVEITQAEMADGLKQQLGAQIETPAQLPAAGPATNSAPPRQPSPPPATNPGGVHVKVLAAVDEFREALGGQLPACFGPWAIQGRADISKLSGEEAGKLLAEIVTEMDQIAAL